jgi:ferredoxin
MTTEYQVSLDRSACEGIFACLVRDDRFLEGEDGLATIDDARARGRANEAEDLVVTFEDDQIEDARQAASACPVDAITVTETETVDVEEKP